MEVYKENNQIIFKFPATEKRINPYDEEGDYGSYPFFTGLIYRHRKNGNNYDDIGFAMTIDMDYKDKGDQFTDIIVRWYSNEESFKKKCAELSIPVVTEEC